MKRLMLFITITLWLVGLYFGYIFIVRKTMKSAPKFDLERIGDLEAPIEDIAEAEKERKEKTQKEKAQEMRQQQRELIKERQRTLRHYQNR